MSPARRVAGLAVAAAALIATTVLSQWPWQAEQGGRSLLRISWRARGERIEDCRRATAEELAALPAHMRQEVVCADPRVAPYRLRVAVDGRSLVDSAAPGSGIRVATTIDCTAAWVTNSRLASSAIAVVMVRVT